MINLVDCLHSQYIRMEAVEDVLRRVLGDILDGLKRKEAVALGEVMAYERKLNQDLSTVRQVVRAKQQQQKKVEAPSMKNLIEEKMETYLESLQTQFKEITLAPKTQAKEKGKPPLRGNSVDRNAIGTKKQHPPKQQPPKEAPVQPVVKPNKMEVFHLATFQKPLQHLVVKEKLPNQLNIKKHLEEYRAEQMGHLQHQRKARSGFLATLGRYAPSKRKIQNDYTDQSLKRGWKGCEYASHFLQYLNQIDKNELVATTDSRARTVDLQKWTLVYQKLTDNHQMIEESKRKIKAPKLLNVEIKYLPPRRQLLQTNIPSFTDIDKSLQPFYLQCQQVLEEFLHKEALKKNDLKLLVQIVNVALSKGKKSYTVIKKSDLSAFLHIIKPSNDDSIEEKAPRRPL